MMSKRESLTQAINTVNPDIIALCETKLGTLSKPKVQGFEAIYENSERGKEGLLIAVKDGTFLSTEKMSEKSVDGNTNILAVQVRYPKFNIRVIVAHAPQESDKLETRQDFFDALKLEVERGQVNGDLVFVVGDMNGKIKENEGVIQKHLNSANGELLCDLVNHHSLCVANFDPNAIGQWTRIQQMKNNEVKSAIDYILLDDKLKNNVLEMIIDECKAFTPYRIAKVGGKKKLTFSDHCTMIVSLDIERGSSTEPDAETMKMWKITDAGLAKYKELSMVRSLYFSGKETTTDMYRMWEQHLENLLSKCFKLRKSRNHTPKLHHEGQMTIRTILNKVSSKGKIQRNVVLTYIRELHRWETEQLEAARTAKLRETLSHFSEDEKTPPNAYWKILKTVRGKEKTKISSLLRSDGVEVYSADSIKHEVIEEFKHRLRNRPPHKQWENYTQATNHLVEMILNVESEDCAEFTLGELILVINKLKKKKSPGPDGVIGEFLMEAGDGILLSLLDILNCVRKTKLPPEQWNDVTIAIIYKNKGSRKSIVNYRGIFLASVVSKVFEKLLKSRIKEHLDKINVCQAGSRSNRSPADNTFILNAVIDHHKYMGKGLFLTAYDFQQAFDSLWLQDCILSLKKLGVPNSTLQVIYNLNRVANIQVKTPHGMTSAAAVEDVVQQGRVLAPDLCSASTAEYVGCNKGVSIGNCNISSLAFVDDMLDISLDSYDAEAANLNAVAFSRKKKLTYNGPKCKTMPVNCKKNQRVPSMFIEGEKIEVVALLKYLGDIFQMNGKNSELIKDRLCRGTKVMLQIEAILSETNFGKHTVDVCLLLYRALFLSSILFNSQAWRNLSERDLAQLQTLQLKLLKKILKVPRSTSNSFIFLELGVLPIRYEIHKRQLGFLHHILHLDEDDPVYQLYLNMKALPAQSNWYNEIKELAINYGICIDEEAVRSVSKETFKRSIKEHIEEFAFQKLQAECSSKKKTSNLVFTCLKPQPYLSRLYPNQARTILQCRAKSLRIKDHQPYLFRNNHCRWCNLDVETVSHLKNCGWDTEMNDVDITDLNEMDGTTDSLLVSLATRVDEFLERVDV